MPPEDEKVILRIEGGDRMLASDIAYFERRLRDAAERGGIAPDLLEIDFSSIEQRIVAHAMADDDMTDRQREAAEALHKAGFTGTGRIHPTGEPRPWPLTPSRINAPPIPTTPPRVPPEARARATAADAGFDIDDGKHTFTERPRKLPGRVRKVAPGLWVRDTKPKPYKGSKAAKKAARMARKRRK